ncbi:MAG: cupin domain-containing protein [Opitutaceae bacterium]|nr:cupin domain-containing protein [Opitutaceae bacterium]MBP9912486.1 cupin domain-containing protein [Opitutaceae bacterium]
MQATPLCLLLLTGSLFASEPAPAVGTPAPGYTMANCVNVFNSAATEKTAVGYQYWFADSTLAEGKTVKLSVVGPHLATHPPHRHAEDEFFLVLNGTAEFYLDGERRTVGAMTLLYCPSWHVHGIRNTSDTELRYLVIKKYARPAPHANATKREPGAAQP